MAQARDVSMAPLEFHHMPASEYLDRYDGITPELMSIWNMMMRWMSPPLIWVMNP